MELTEKDKKALKKVLKYWSKVVMKQILFTKKSIEQYKKERDK